MGHCSKVDGGLSFADVANGVLQLLYALMTCFKVPPYLAFRCILLTLSHAPCIYMSECRSDSKRPSKLEHLEHGAVPG